MARNGRGSQICGNQKLYDMIRSMTGYGRAEKRQIQEMVKLYLNLPKIPKPDDAADALAIALTHAQTNKMASQFSL